MKRLQALERKDSDMKGTRYSDAKEYELKKRVPEKQGTMAKKEGAERAKTEKHRYRMVEDENSIYEYDLNCKIESEG